MIATSEIILASASGARQQMLKQVGINFSVKPADIDEGAILDKLTSENHQASHITEQLAQAKAQRVSAENLDAVVIGSDQTLEFEGKILSKSSTPEEAREVLKSLSGKTHRLYSSVCVAQNSDTVFIYTDYADLTMHDFDDKFLGVYIAKDPDALKYCVGGYKIEGAGVSLFESVKGDHYTIMGMPLLPLLAFLRINYKIM